MTEEITVRIGLPKQILLDLALANLALMVLDRESDERKLTPDEEKQAGSHFGKLIGATDAAIAVALSAESHMEQCARLAAMLEQLGHLHLLEKEAVVRSPLYNAFVAYTDKHPHASQDDPFRHPSIARMREYMNVLEVSEAYVQKTFHHDTTH